MVKILKVNSEKNECNSYVSNQFKIMNAGINKLKQTKTWPLAFKAAILNQKTFPESWSASPVNGRIYKSVI